MGRQTGKLQANGLAHRLVEMKVVKMDRPKVSVRTDERLLSLVGGRAGGEQRKSAGAYGNFIERQLRGIRTVRQIRGRSGKDGGFGILRFSGEI